MGKNYWMMVASPEHFAITKERGFTIYGVRSKYRRRAQRMQPDDRILFYVTGLRKWTATATITSQFFEDRTPIWNVNGKTEVYPFRVKTRPEIVLGEDDYIDALLLAPRLDYVKRWAPEDWPLAFFESLHLIPQKDFRLVEGEMNRFVGPKRNGRNRNRPGAFNDRQDRRQDEGSDHQWQYSESNTGGSNAAAILTPTPSVTPVSQELAEGPIGEHEIATGADQTPNEPVDEREVSPTADTVDQVTASPSDGQSEYNDDRPQPEDVSARTQDSQGQQGYVVEDHPATDDSSTGSSST